MVRRLQSQLGLPFFGLTSKDNTQPLRKNLFTLIHEIVFHGNGGYDFDTVYNMPIWLRSLVFNRIQDFNNQQKKSAEEGNSESTTLIDSDGKINIPAFANASKANTTIRTSKSKR